MDVIDILDDKLQMKALKDWPPVWRQFINNVESVELSDGEGWLKKD
jgi:phage terminase small subunit